MIYVAIITALGYGFFGFIHISGNMAQAAIFRSWGFPSQIMFGFGLCQIIGAILLLIKKTNIVGGALLVPITMVIIMNNLTEAASSIKMLIAYILLGGCLFILRLWNSD